MATINGTEFNDDLTGSSGADTMTGLGGDDHLAGGAGNDSINGGAGQDMLEGGAGVDTLVGGIGHDWLVGGADNDILFGDDGIDYAVYTDATSAVNANLDTGTSSGGGGVDTFHEIEGLVGSAFNDTLDGNWDNNDLTGGEGDDLMRGFGGTDYFEGNGGTDTLLGGDGDDFFIGGSADLMDGGSGNDAAYYNWNRDQVTIVADGDRLLLTSSMFAGQDTIVGGIELLQFKTGDRAVATGDAKVALQLVSALFGHASIEDKPLVGQYWGLLQSGLTLQEVATIGVASAKFALDAGSHGTTAAIDHVFANVGDALPSAATAQFHQSLATSAAQSQGAMAALAAQQLAPVATDMATGITAQAASTSAGTAGADNLVGTTGADYMFGRAGNDVFDAKAGSDVIDGGAGLDRAVFAGTKASHTVTHSDLGLSVKQNSSSDTDMLLSVERVTFSDTSLAFDASGSAGTVAKLVAAIFGPEFVSNKVIAGLGLQQLDAGVSEQAIAEGALSSSLFAFLAGGHDNAHFVERVYFNVMGTHASEAQADYYTMLLDDGWLTQGQLAVLAAHDTHNVAHVDLVGIAHHGLEFQPA